MGGGLQATTHVPYSLYNTITQASAYFLKSAKLAGSRIGADYSTCQLHLTPTIYVGELSGSESPGIRVQVRSQAFCALAKAVYAATHNDFMKADLCQCHLWNTTTDHTSCWMSLSKSQ